MARISAMKRLPVAGIGRRIREIRGALSQEDFCKRVGIPVRTLARYEMEETYPTADTLATICKVFRIDGSWLLSGEVHSASLTIPPTAHLADR